MLSFIKKHKKKILYILIQNVILLSFIGVFFYYKFYQPLQNDSYLFSKKNSSEIDIRKLNNEFILQEGGLLEDKEGNRSIEDAEFGLTATQTRELIENKKTIHFIDVREREEFNAGHIKSARHIRSADLTISNIKSLFNINDRSFDENIFILVCHDGGRGLLTAKKLDKNNIKYLIKGIEYSNLKENNIKVTGPIVPDYEIFGEKYQTKYQMLAKDAISFIKKSSNVLIIDGRHITYYQKKHIKGSIHTKIGHMTTDEYENTLKVILKRKGADLIILPDRYSELFYANLLLLRLERDYGFDDNDFHIVFNQFEEFEKDPDINFESNF